MFIGMVLILRVPLPATQLYLEYQNLEQHGRRGRPVPHKIAQQSPNTCTIRAYQSGSVDVDFLSRVDVSEST